MDNNNEDYVREYAMRRPLLAHAGEDELWDSVDAGEATGGENGIFSRTVADLIHQAPGEAIRELEKTGARKVAEFMVPVRFPLLEPG